jgi:hypothetical protein
VDTKRRLTLIASVLALLLGSVGGFTLLGGWYRYHPANAWEALDFSFALAFAAYLVLIGNRGFRWAAGHLDPHAARVKWGRTLLGAWLIFMQAKNYYHPAANLLKPSSPVEAQSMRAAELLLVLIGLVLIASGSKTRIQRALETWQTRRQPPQPS